MKFRNTAIALSISLLTLFACQNAVEEKTTEVLEEKLATVEMKVDGMVCAMGCAKFIQDKVAEQEGVKESKVDFESETAYFTFNENAISAEELEKFIDEIHDGQYDATIAVKGMESSSTEVSDDKQEEETMEEEEESVEEEKSVVQVVSKMQNISFPELLTYFMKRL